MAVSAAGRNSSRGEDGWDPPCLRLADEGRDKTAGPDANELLKALRDAGFAPSLLPCWLNVGDGLGMDTKLLCSLRLLKRAGTGSGTPLVEIGVIASSTRRPSSVPSLELMAQLRL